LEFLKVGAARRGGPTQEICPSASLHETEDNPSSTKKSLENKNFSRILKVKICLAEFKGEIKL
jgi:hypothetical protein